MRGFCFGAIHFNYFYEILEWFVCRQCPRDDNDVPQTEDEVLLDHARNLASADVPEPIRRSILAERERKTKTGVKGVLADYKAAKAMEEAQAQAEAMSRAAIITRMVEGFKIQADPNAPPAKVI